MSMVHFRLLPVLCLNLSTVSTTEGKEQSDALVIYMLLRLGKNQISLL